MGDQLRGGEIEGKGSSGRREREKEEGWQGDEKLNGKRDERK